MNGLSMGDALAAAWGSWMFAMTWQVMFFAALIWGVARLAGRAPAAFRYGLWLLVFVKLILPPTLSADWAFMNLFTMAVHEPVLHVTHSIPPVPGVIQIPIVGGNNLVQGEKLAQQQPFLSDGKRMETSGMNVPPGTQNPLLLLMEVWAGVALGLFGIFVLKYRRYVKRVMCEAVTATPEIVRLMEEQAMQYGLRRTFSLVVSPWVNTPVVFGVRHPKILLPQRAVNELSPQQVRFLLAHELAHVKRYDEIMGWVVILLVCLYWFNPVVWLASVFLRREREMACDDMVVSTTRHAHKEYASTMVHVAEYYDGTAPAVAGFLGLLGVTDNLMFRVRSVLDLSRNRRVGLRSGVVLVLFLLFVAPMGGITPSSTAQSPAASPGAEKPSDSGETLMKQPLQEQLLAEVDREIQAHYAKADINVQEFVRWTAKKFGPANLWLPETAFDSLSADEREQKVGHAVEALNGEYGRHLCDVLAQAGALKDKQLLPGVMKAAAYHRENGDYDCRPKWMAVAALGRIGDESAVPLLVSLIDHGNKNTKLWAQASLVRITGQNFGVDKKAWGSWWNGAKKQPPITEEQMAPWKVPVVSDASQKPALPGEAQTSSASPTLPPGEASPQKDPNVDLLQADVDREIQEHYAKASPEVQEYVRWTAKNFGRANLWIPETAFDSLSADEREKKIVFVAETLNGEYGRHLCEVLAQAGALKDKRLLPGVMKAAAYHQENKSYDCRAKWMAVAALGRIGDESAVPLLVSLVDHGNQNTRMWARASLVRITGENFDADKKAWGNWWNGAKKLPPVTEEQMKPWKVSDKP